MLSCVTAVSHHRCSLTRNLLSQVHSRATARLCLSQLRILYIKGGLLLSIYLHHAFGDGSCLDSFLEDLALETRDTTNWTVSERQLKLPQRSCQVSVPLPVEIRAASFEELLDKCPEYSILVQPTGPTQPVLRQIAGIADRQVRYIGKIFVIEKRRLDDVRERLQLLINTQKAKPCAITRYITLATLTWVHTARARLASDSCPSRTYHGWPPTFFNPVDWNSPTKNLFPGNQSVKQYFGNSVAMAMSVLDNAEELVEACTWDLDCFESQKATGKLAKVAERIQEAISCINEGFVLTRTRLFETAPDIRRLGISLDARAPQNFSFNTWMHIGTKARLWFPGLSAAPSPGTPRPPDAIRRVHGAWALSQGLILPECGVEDDALQLLLTLPEAAIDCLKGDAQWMSLVKRVVD